MQRRPEFSFLGSPAWGAADRLLPPCPSVTPRPREQEEDEVVWWLHVSRQASPDYHHSSSGMPSPQLYVLTTLSGKPSSARHWQGDARPHAGPPWVDVRAPPLTCWRKDDGINTRADEPEAKSHRDLAPAVARTAQEAGRGRHIWGQLRWTLNTCSPGTGSVGWVASWFDRWCDRVVKVMDCVNPLRTEKNLKQKIY
jgi:hypothetical protein